MTLPFPDAVERWPLDRLIPHARNARTHSEDQVAQIAGSIAEFGWTNPDPGVPDCPGRHRCAALALSQATIA
jgi:hypothetical protein